MEFCNHPVKGGQMNQKQYASPRTHFLVTFIPKWDKKTSSHVEIFIIYLQTKNKKKNETRLKQSRAFNNDDENYLQIFTKKTLNLNFPILLHLLHLCSYVSL